ncbi:hypothetical protein RRG08_038621 [Elysia crispata]|uniref:Uncharacterized protein n=1 Tax=Elysia crispata TaxID=231223 RepID=A0AAE0YKH9_9GAST|nr:hypothetical protein RRG08_038621 [Elysia crispata]
MNKFRLGPGHDSLRTSEAEGRYDNKTRRGGRDGGKMARSRGATTHPRSLWTIAVTSVRFEARPHNGQLRGSFPRNTSQKMTLPEAARGAEALRHHPLCPSWRVKFSWPNSQE